MGNRTVVNFARKYFGNTVTAVDFAKELTECLEEGKDDSSTDSVNKCLYKLNSFIEDDKCTVNSPVKSADSVKQIISFPGLGDISIRYTESNIQYKDSPHMRQLNETDRNTMDDYGAVVFGFAPSTAKGKIIKNKLAECCGKPYTSAEKASDVFYKILETVGYAS